MEELLLKSGVGLIAALFGLIAWFFRRLISQLDHVSSNYSDLNLELKTKLISIESEIKNLPAITLSVAQLTRYLDKMKRDLEIALVAAEKIKVAEAEIAVLKRNQDTIFRKLDESFDALNKISDLLNNSMRKGELK
jgi:hypothetical protein